MDGIYDIRITNVDMEGQAGVNSNATHHLLLRMGQTDNPMVFPKVADYSDTLLSTSDGKYTLNNSAPGAQYLRYSGNFGQAWSDWVPYQQSLEMDDLTFKNNWWKGSHVIVQYYSNITLSAQHIQHGDADYTGARRRYPHLGIRPWRLCFVCQPGG
jgi:alpha-1,3-glucan synthase